MELNRQSEYAIVDDHQTARIIRPEYGFKALFELSLLPIRYYGRRDFIVLSSLLRVVYQIALADQECRAQKVLEDFVTSLVGLSKACIGDTAERNMLNNRLSEIRKLRYFESAMMDQLCNS